MNTAFYTSLLALLWLSLTMYVILGRWKYGVSLGDGKERDLNRRIRAHANFVETVPLALILLWIGEIHVFNPEVVHGFGITLVVSRLFHAFGMLFPKRSTNRFRQIGMALTMITVGVESFWILGTIVLNP